jgi:hypothetical protein
MSGDEEAEPMFLNMNWLPGI